MKNAYFHKVRPFKWVGWYDVKQGDPQTVAALTKRGAQWRLRHYTIPPRLR